MQFFFQLCSAIDHLLHLIKIQTRSLSFDLTCTVVREYTLTKDRLINELVETVRMGKAIRKRLDVPIFEDLK